MHLLVLFTRNIIRSLKTGILYLIAVEHRNCHCICCCLYILCNTLFSFCILFSASYLLFITFLLQFLLECWVLTVDMGTEPKHHATVCTKEAEFGRRESELTYHKEGWVWPWWRWWWWWWWYPVSSLWWIRPLSQPPFYLASPNIKTYQRPPSMLLPAFLFLTPILKKGGALAWWREDRGVCLFSLPLRHAILCHSLRDIS